MSIVNSLQAWTDSDAGLTIKALVSNRLASIPGIHTVGGVYGTSYDVPYVSSTPIFRSPSCTQLFSGTTTLGARNVTMCGIQLEESLCNLDIKNTLMAGRMTSQEDIPNTDIIMQEKQKQIAKFSQNLALNGNAAAGAGSLSLCNGMLYKLDTVYSASTVRHTLSAYTTTNAINIIDTVVNGLPDAALEQEQVCVLIPIAAFNKVKQNLRNNNWFHHAVDGGDSYTMKHPGFDNVTIFGIPDMQANRTICTFNENIIHLLSVDPENALKGEIFKRNYEIYAEWYEAWDFHFESFVSVM